MRPDITNIKAVLLFNVQALENLKLEIPQYELKLPIAIATPPDVKFIG